MHLPHFLYVTLCSSVFLKYDIKSISITHMSIACSSRQSLTLTVLTVLSKLQIQHHLFDFQLQSCMTHSSLPHLSISIISQAWLSSHLVSFSLSYQPAVSFYQPLFQLSPLHSCLLSSHIDLKSKTTTVTIVFNIYLIWTTFENSSAASGSSYHL